MTIYTHLSLENREKVYRLHADGIPLRQIAIAIGKATSTVSREIKRNASKLGYLPDRAQNKATMRRHRSGFKIQKYPQLKQFIIDKLTIDKWSPQIIAARLKDCNLAATLSHESIYKFIYSVEGQLAKLYQHLMFKRPKRNIHYGRKHRMQMPDQYKIINRPEVINSRTEFGHYEGDLTFMKGSQSSNLLVLIERVTRKSFIIENSNKQSISTMHKIYSTLASLPSNMRKSITFDNGSEFKRFGCLSFIGVKVYFCKPASPWQKGQVERLNAQLHKYIPKTSDIRSVTKSQVLAAQDKLNNLPRKVLGYLTPNEAWAIHSITSVALQT
jgi:IS30 family transposase